MSKSEKPAKKLGRIVPRMPLKVEDALAAFMAVDPKKLKKPKKH